MFREDTNHGGGGSTACEIRSLHESLLKEMFREDTIAVNLKDIPYSYYKQYKISRWALPTSIIKGQRPINLLNRIKYRHN